MMVCLADNKHFALRVNGKDYPAKIGAFAVCLLWAACGGLRR
jgi:hypothetical protein